MTRSQLRFLVSSWLDDLNQSYFTSDQINTWINLAQRRVQMLLLQAGENWYMKPVETLTVVGQADYVLPSDHMITHRVEYVITGTGTNEVLRPLGEITTNQQDLISKNLGTPSNFYIKKDRITISPTPDQANKVIRLFYSPLVQDLANDADEPDVPEQFHEYVALLAAEDGFIKDDRAPTNLLVKKEKYEALLKEMAEDRTQDVSRSVVQVQDFDFPGWDY